MSSHEQSKVDGMILVREGVINATYTRLDESAE